MMESSPAESLNVDGASSSAMADWIELTKPRIVTMILVTSVASTLVAGAIHANSLSLAHWIGLMFGIALVAGSAGAANQIWERQLDLRMTRTARRPLPGGRIGAAGATIAMLLSGLIGTAVLTASVGVMPAAMGLATWLLYVVVYTPLKTRTAWNTTVGAAAGALPMFIGYTACGGQFDELAGWMLFGVLALWQYPHFMAIAWLYRHQYHGAGFVMSTTTDPSGRSAAWQSIAGAIALVGCGVALCLAPHGFLSLSLASVGFAILVVLAGYPLLRSAIQFACSPSDASARTMMRWSLVVLPVVLLVMTVRVLTHAPAGL